ncbi:hypothetical protein BI317_25560 (plasmid) [Xanthomonas hortorum pv. gardneri]|nr:hypothetical protein BI317_25560 [Xanthomonas hortorum pv. gardneri]
MKAALESNSGGRKRKNRPCQGGFFFTGLAGTPEQWGHLNDSILIPPAKPCKRERMRRPTSQTPRPAAVHRRGTCQQ